MHQRALSAQQMFEMRGEGIKGVLEDFIKGPELIMRALRDVASTHQIILRLVVVVEKENVNILSPNITAANLQY